MCHFGPVYIRGGAIRFVIEKTPEEERESLRNASDKRYRRIMYVMLGSIGATTHNQVQAMRTVSRPTSRWDGLTTI